MPSPGAPLEGAPLGQQLKQLREAREERQSSVGAKVGCAQSKISEIERGKTLPSKALLNKLLTHFRLPQESWSKWHALLAKEEKTRRSGRVDDDKASTGAASSDAAPKHHPTSKPDASTGVATTTHEAQSGTEALATFPSAVTSVRAQEAAGPSPRSESPSGSKSFQSVPPQGRQTRTIAGVAILVLAAVLGPLLGVIVWQSADQRANNAVVTPSESITPTVQATTPVTGQLSSKASITSKTAGDSTQATAGPGVGQGVVAPEPRTSATEDVLDEPDQVTITKSPTPKPTPTPRPTSSSEFDLLAATPDVEWGVSRGPCSTATNKYDRGYLLSSTGTRPGRIEFRAPPGSYSALRIIIGPAFSTREEERRRIAVLVQSGPSKKDDEGRTVVTPLPATMIQYGAPLNQTLEIEPGALLRIQTSAGDARQACIGRLLLVP